MTDAPANDEAEVRLPPGHQLINTVLIVDEPSETEPLGEFLESVGWEVLVAENAGQARGLIARHKPEFILTELALPRLTGFELCANEKREDCRTPIIIHTSVQLDTARNLAVWAGADGYVMKPFSYDKLYWKMLDIALAVKARVKRAEKGLQGGIDFQCECGRKLAVSTHNAGKAVICPSCRNLVRAPQMVIDSSVLFRRMQEEAGLGTSGSLGLFCDKCSAPLDLSKRGGERRKCGRCGSPVTIPNSIMNQWEFFFQDVVAELPPRNINPLKYVHVLCEECDIYHAFFGENDKPVPCRRCGRNPEFPSIRGAALSKAALNSTGRLFRVFLPDGTDTLFLLPADCRISLGTGDKVSVQLPDETLGEKHCFFRHREGRVTVIPIPGNDVVLNEQVITEQTQLKPNDVVALNEIRFEFQGNRDLDETLLMQSMFKQVEAENRVRGKVEFAQPGARILQLHWEQQRERWLDHERKRPKPLRKPPSVIRADPKSEFDATLPKLDDTDSGFEIDIPFASRV